MSDVHIVESVSEVDGGYLADNRRIVAVFSSFELAEGYVKEHEKDYDNYEIDSWAVDDEESEGVE